MLEEDDDECEIYDPQAEADYEGSASVREMSKLYILKIVVAKSTNRRISRLHRGGSRIADGAIAIDSAAMKSIFRDRSLFLAEPTVSDRPVEVSGINGDGESLFVTREGMTAFGVVYFDPRATVNILSFRQAVDYFDRVQYDSGSDTFTVRVSQWSRAMVFRPDHNTGLYIHNPHTDDLAVVEVMVTTVDDRTKKYTKREVKAAESARELQKKFFYLGDSSLKLLLRKGKIKNTGVTAIDIERANDIWGPSLGGLKGRSTSHKAAPVAPTKEKIRCLEEVNQTMHADLMEVHGVWYLVTILDPVEYVQVSRVKSRDKYDIWQALESHLKFPEKFGLRAATIRVDGESAIATDWMVAKTGHRIDSGGAATHVPMVERKIRTLKERVRSMVCTLPYNLTEKLEEWLIKAAVYSINLVPTVNSVSYNSPRERLYGVIIDANKDLKHSYGDYVQVHEEEISNRVDIGRTRGAIALRPTGAMDGSWYYWILETAKVVRRLRATVLPISQDVIDAINRAARKRKYKRQVQGTVRVQFDRWNIPGELEFEANPWEDEFMFEQHRRHGPVEVIEMPHGVVVDGDHYADIELDDMASVDTQAGQNEQYYHPPDEVERQQLINDIFGEDSDEDDDVQLDGDQVAALADDVQLAGEYGDVVDQAAAHPYNLRSRGQLVGYTGTNRGAEKIYGLRLQIKEAIKKCGYEAIKSMVKEVHQLLSEHVFDGVDATTLSSDEWKTVIPSMCFLKEKYSPLGEFIKLKARLVAGGHRQDKSIYGDNKSSPTVATQSVFMVAAIAASEGRVVGAVDVPGAFLKSPMPSEGPPVLMKLDKFLTSILLELDDSYKKFVRHDGTCVVVLRKALYGTIQAAKCWYEKLSSDLQNLGYKPNPQDICVFNRVDPTTAAQTTICIHVDDLLITTATDSLLDKAIAEIGSLYNDERASITVQKGSTIEYIGMIFKFGDDGTVRVTMDGYVTDLLTDVNDIEGVAKTPATSELFTTRPTAVALDDDRRERFHSVVAKILYLAKRVRPELLVAISFLARRVQHPDVDDWDKMIRLIRYIRGSKDLGIRLCGSTQLAVTAYIDASFGVHSDLKSHTGCTITIGKGPVYAKSSVQRLNTVSSAEAELVGLADSVGQVIWTREWLLNQGYSVSPATVYEDNQSAIKLAENGRSNSSRTRHIAVRYFFIHDRMNSGEIAIEYLHTSQMVADILTKPMQGSQFLRLRQLLLNWD